MIARRSKPKTSVLTVRNFKRICGLNGLTPTEAAFLAGRHRDTVYKALRDPARYKPTITALERLLPKRLLPNREVPHANTR